MARNPIVLDELHDPHEDVKVEGPKRDRQVPVFSRREPFWWAIAALIAMGAALAFVLLL